jgi:hypothetical protein
MVQMKKQRSLGRERRFGNVARSVQDVELDLWNIAKPNSGGLSAAGKNR